MRYGHKHWDWMEAKYRLFRDSIIAIAVLLLLLIGCILSSCKTCIPVIEYRDSVRIVEVHTRDTAIITKADSASIHALLRCDSSYNVVLDELVLLQGSHINANIHTHQHSNGALDIELDCKEDSLVNIIQLRDSVIKVLSNHTTVQQIEVIPKFYRGCTIALWILVGLLALGMAICLIIKFVKK